MNTIEQYEWLNKPEWAIRNEINRRLGDKSPFAVYGGFHQLDFVLKLINFIPDDWYLKIYRPGDISYGAAFCQEYPGVEYGEIISDSLGRAICIAWLKWHDIHGGDGS